MFQTIKNRFATDDVEVKRKDLCKVVVKHEKVFELIYMLRDTYNYKILNAITCTDWIEEEHFALTYILSTLDRTNSFMVQTFVSRNETQVPTLSLDFKQAQIMERDLHEMYGINFVGNNNLVELNLENWTHTPPLRREFDTLEFVKKHLMFREGRDDNVDTKVETKRLRELKKAAKKAAEAKKAKEAETKEKEDNNGK